MNQELALYREPRICGVDQFRPCYNTVLGFIARDQRNAACCWT